MPGQVLRDGVGCVINFTNVLFPLIIEKTMQPPGIEDRGMIDTTNMRNTNWVTEWPKKLKKLSKFSFKVQYNSANALNALIVNAHVVQLCTIGFADGSSFSFYGAITGVQPDEISEGNQPTLTLTVTPTMEFNCTEQGYSFVGYNGC